MRCSIFFVFIGFIAICFAFPVIDHHGSSTEELSNEREGSSSSEELTINRPTVPPSSQFPEVRGESKLADEETESKRARRDAMAPPEVYSTTHTPDEQKEDAIDHEGSEMVYREKRNGLNPSYVPPTFGVGPAEEEEEGEGAGAGEAGNDRIKRNGLNPSYIPPTFGIGPAETEEEGKRSGEAREERIKRNGLNPSYVPPTFGIGPAEDGETQGAGNEKDERIKRQIDENEDEFGGRGPITPPPFFPDENKLLMPTTVAELEKIEETEGNKSEQEAEMEKLERRKRCSTCNEGKQRVGDEGTVENGEHGDRGHEGTTSGPFDSGANKGQNNDNVELFERVRRQSETIENSASDAEEKSATTATSQDKGISTIDDVPTDGKMRKRRGAFVQIRRKSQLPDHWAEDQDELVEKILRHQMYN